MGQMNLIVQNRPLMGSPFEIRSYWPKGKSKKECLAFMNMAFGEILRIENLLTDFRDSPFNRINQAAGKKAIKVPREIFNLVKTTLRLSEESEGAFDISYASVGHLWRQAMKKGSPPSDQEIEALKPFVNFRKIEINESASTIYLPDTRMRIGLGGIGKGYAVDRAFEMLLGLGLNNFSVNGAGDIRVHSESKAPRPWRIGIRNPFSSKDTPLGALTLRCGAVATSGDYERFFRHKGIHYHHVLNGQTGNIAQGVASVTILGNTATITDTLATTIMSLGEKKGLEFLNMHRNVSGFLVTTDGRLLKCQKALSDFEKTQNENSTMEPRTC